ncbi:uncharacterized protein MELLADRAFT_76421 [Melampsora larici-populina 98AG31]|uniref:Secreted protein n=1 Tax=Melampsora larici-populina (strain 98AG31 / pathotype 3-4-7) TaxID=747676 RepID=F4R649_MELLP|nr:uncharacterized protein MELLADRAFT_76421 [Melampsora larici-populina 98AG31]EGG12530.1 secreted protein [Melampsora larici-populina 98AG31]
MKFYILLTIILQISPRLGDINSVSVFHMSDSALDERSSFSPLQKRKTSRNVVECRPTDRAPFGGILQDCLVCAGQLSKHHLSCTMLKTCAVVIVEPTTGKPSKVEKMSVEELVYRLPQSLDSTCTVTPLLRFFNKTFTPTPDSQKSIGMLFFDKPLTSEKVQICDQETLRKFGYVKI